MKIAEQNRAKLAAVYSGLVFGIYWIPLRALAEHGITGVWPVVFINVIPLLVLLPVQRQSPAQHPSLHVDREALRLSPK